MTKYKLNFIVVCSEFQNVHNSGLLMYILKDKKKVFIVLKEKGVVFKADQCFPLLTNEWTMKEQTWKACLGKNKHMNF